jgi:hypothetical protein
MSYSINGFFDVRVSTEEVDEDWINSQNDILPFEISDLLKFNIIEQLSFDEDYKQFRVNVFGKFSDRCIISDELNIHLWFDALTKSNESEGCKCSLAFIQVDSKSNPFYRHFSES